MGQVSASGMFAKGSGSALGARRILAAFRHG